MSIIIEKFILIIFKNLGHSSLNTRKFFRAFLIILILTPKFIQIAIAAVELSILCFPISFKSMFLILTFLLFKSL